MDDVILYCSYGVKHQIRFGAFILFLLRALEQSILFLFYVSNYEIQLKMDYIIKLKLCWSSLFF